jgi:AraC-like DNA-binding protein
MRARPLRWFPVPIKIMELRRFRTATAAPLVENAAALDPCFLRHLLPPELGSGVRVQERQGAAFAFFAARYGCPSVQAWGVLPSRSVMLALVSEAEVPLRVNGLDCPRHSLLAFGEGSPMFICADSPVTLLACGMDRSQLPLAWLLARSGAAAEPGSFLVTRLPGESGLRWSEALAKLAGLTEDSDASPRATGQPAEREMQALLADLAPPAKYLLRMRRSPQARRQAQLAVALREEGGDGSDARKLGVPELMQRLGVRRRTLEYEIHGLTGMSPHAWLTALRLDRVRVDLMQPRGAVSVGDIATRWGFLHQGRFARAYSTRFGELPRVTAARTARKEPGLRPIAAPGSSSGQRV